MNYKSILIYFLTFIIGLAIGKTLKINIKKGGCPIAQSKLEELRKKMNSDSSETYL